MRWIFFSVSDRGTLHQVLYITVVHADDHIKMIEILPYRQDGNDGSDCNRDGKHASAYGCRAIPSMITQDSGRIHLYLVFQSFFFMRVRITSSAEEDLQNITKADKSILFIYNLQMEYSLNDFTSRFMISSSGNPVSCNNSYKLS